MELRKAIELFLAQYKKKSRETYGYNLKNFANFVGPKRLIAQLTPLHILEYQQYVEGRSLAPATRITYFKMVKIFFNWLTKMELVEKSPARALKIQRTSAHVEKTKAMTDEELTRVLDWVKWHPRDFALITFLADTGCRAGGAAGLRVGDIDFDALRAIVTEKGEKTRPVSFEAVCARALRVWLDKRPAKAGMYVFSDTVKPLQAASISQIVTRACVRAGVRPLGSHSLRHRKGHQLAFGHVPPTIAALAMGHSDPETTMKAYFPAGWAKTDEILRSFAIKEGDVPGSQVPAEPKTPEEKPRIFVLKKGG
jgi:integrase/recombinase XerC